VLDSIAPIRESRVRNSTQEWFDGEVNDNITIRDKLFKKFKKNKLQINYDIYREARIKARKAISNEKISFFEEKLNQNIGKPKELWKTLKDLGLPNKKSSGSTKVCLKKENGDICFDSNSNSEIFMNFFSDLAKNLLRKLPSPPTRYTIASLINYYSGKTPETSFTLKPVSEEEVIKIMKDLDITKAAGIDNIKAIFLKDGASILGKPISKLCNLSIRLSIFPEKCKIAKLKPLFKKGSKTEPKNYRPISLLPLISKIFEKVVHDQTQNFLKENNLLYNYQSGFRSSHSTAFALSYLNDKILKGFEKGMVTGMILIDLQKAFDTIDHKILLRKLSVLNFSSDTIMWFKSYLSNRTFQVSIEKSLSQPGKLDCGVPQGSILGPLIFLLYVNDMPMAINKCNLFLYADDSCLVFQHKNVNEIKNVLTEEFKDLCEWFVDNKLSIHFGEDKTKSILFAPKGKSKKLDSLDISLGNIEIKQHSKVSYLGCILDENLNGESMALNVIKKINMRLMFLYRKNKFLTPQLRRMLCNALIQPHFDYACTAWYPNLNKNLLKKLQIMQNKCIRFCLQLDNRSHIGEAQFKKINWLPVNDRVSQISNVYVFKYFAKKTPYYIGELFENLENRSISTRNSFLKLRQPSVKTNFGKKALFFTAPALWNKLSCDLKQCKSVNSFKHAIKRNLFKELEEKEKDIYIF